MQKYSNENRNNQPRNRKQNGKSFNEQTSKQMSIEKDGITKTICIVVKVFRYRFIRNATTRSIVFMQISKWFKFSR